MKFLVYLVAICIALQISHVVQPVLSFAVKGAAIKSAAVKVANHVADEAAKSEGRMYPCLE